ncbi:hypothetical protein KC345_g1440 [Hortaea werneckii]|nr:hypothetical protein KC345_g1440 [Hortaea werneckii]
MKNLLQNILIPQIEAAEQSFHITGKYGVWQVVDEPGAAGDVSYEYYTSRPTALDDLLGTSAFVLAGLEVEEMFPEIGCQRHDLAAPFGP